MDEPIGANVLASSANATWDGPCRSFKCRVISDAKRAKIKQCRVAVNDARFACCRDTQPGVLKRWHSSDETAGSCCHGGLKFNAGVPWDASNVAKKKLLRIAGTGGNLSRAFSSEEYDALSSRISCVPARIRHCRFESHEFPPLLCYVVTIEYSLRFQFRPAPLDLRWLSLIAHLKSFTPLRLACD